MRVGVMVTNNGTHSAQKWAAESAAQIVDVIKIEPESIVFQSMTAEKARLEGLIEAALVAHHDANQKNEVDAIEEHKFDRLDHPTRPDESQLADAVASVQAVASQTMFGEHFHKPEVIKFVESTIGSHFATVKQIERSQFADKNLNHPKAKAFKAR
jgi:hypothetical protein